MEKKPLPKPKEDNKAKEDKKAKEQPKTGKGPEQPAVASKKSKEEVEVVKVDPSKGSDPVFQIQAVVEKKIRNLEKRKVRSKGSCLLRNVRECCFHPNYITARPNHLPQTASLG